MPNTPHNCVVSYYKQLAELSTRIVTHVQNQHWVLAADLSRTYETTLLQMQHLPSLTPDERKARRIFLNIILANDAQIRHLMNPNSQFAQQHWLHTSPKKSRHSERPIYN